MIEQTVPSPFERMEAMYRYQRYFYDATRKYYLLGRDRLIDEMPVRDGDKVVEIGCGTGRNLNMLAARYPAAKFYGLDASTAMLETATANASRYGIDNVVYRGALAGDFRFDRTFSVDCKFDIAYFSYSISMIPDWKQAIMNAIENVRPGGLIYIVDFYDQRELPPWFRVVLKAWLRRFHVQFWDQLIPYLHYLDSSGFGDLEIRSVARRYAFIARFLLRDDS